MSYRKNSKWNDENELRCLVIFKELKENNFTRGMQKQLCEKLSVKTGISIGSISAKVCNYKSIAGINKHSNYSQNTEYLWKKYKDSSVSEIKNIYQ